MTTTFYPKRILLTAVFLIVFGAALSAAAGVRSGVAVGVLGLTAYVLIEFLISVNPAMWWQGQPERRR